MRLLKEGAPAAVFSQGVMGVTADRATDRAEARLRFKGRNETLHIGKFQIFEASIIGDQSAINFILSNAMKKAMLARGGRLHAINVIDPAVSPEWRSSPLGAE